MMNELLENFVMDRLAEVRFVTDAPEVELQVQAVQKSAREGDSLNLRAWAMLWQDHPQFQEGWGPARTLKVAVGNRLRVGDPRMTTGVKVLDGVVEAVDHLGGFVLRIEGWDFETTVYFKAERKGEVLVQHVE